MSLVITLQRNVGRANRQSGSKVKAKVRLDGPNGVNLKPPCSQIPTLVHAARSNCNEFRLLWATVSTLASLRIYSTGSYEFGRGGI